MESELHRLGTEILLQSVIDTVQDGLTVIDREMNVVFQNEAIRRMYGPIVGRKCFEAYRGRDEPCPYCSVLKVFDDGGHHRALEDTRTADGSVMWMECSCGPLKNDAGELVGAVEIVRDVTEQMVLSEQCATLKRQVRRVVDFENIVTQCKPIKELFGIIERVAPTTSPVLLTGESGTGKELFARALWQHSDRAEGPFVPVNCAAIPDDLIESELFGHAEGAFTGAARARTGIIESADGGTLFLDEIAEIPVALQPKLLRFLQEGEIRRVGDDRARAVDVRVVTATNRDLEEAIREGAFRQDLYYRVGVIPMHLPPLRHRREDIPLLANHLLQRLCEEHRRALPGIDPDAMRALLEHPWPGNVRELENAVEYALHLTDDGQPLRRAQLPRGVGGEGAGGAGGAVELDAPLSIDEYTRQVIVALQEDHEEQEIAAALGISRKTLWEKRKRWGLPRPGA